MSNNQTYEFTCRFDGGGMPHGMMVAKFVECVSEMLTSLQQDSQPYLSEVSFFNGTMSLTMLLVPRKAAE
jgi:hypothetical protein